jgi:hypothetical protein
VRKKDPNDVIDDYQELLAISLVDLDSVCLLVDRSDLKKNACVEAFLNAAIGWESFLTDWHIAAINRDSSAFVADLTTKLEQSTENKWPGLKGRINLAIPKHPTLQLVQELVDPEGANISFGDRDKWRSRVERELVDPYKARVVALVAADHQLISTVVAIRNCIVHRSQMASDRMNDELANLRSADKWLRRGEQRVRPSGIGAYLLANAGGARRVLTYHRRLLGIAEHLRV